jgi:Mg2+ and Co2+ transporter CorA
MPIVSILFGPDGCEEVDSWSEALTSVADDELLWIDLEDVGASGLAEVCGALGMGDAGFTTVAGGSTLPRTEEREGQLHVVAIAVSDAERDPDLEEIPVECFVGSNWVVTIHAVGVAALDEFRDTARGEGEVGTIDGPSFLAMLLEWVVASYVRAFDEVEESLEEFDLDAMTRAARDQRAQIEVLVRARRRVGRLRRSLAPHRELFSALSHSELEALSSTESAERFSVLTSRLDVALGGARDTKESIASSYDLLLVRTEHRTNEIVKVLTLASILLLPGALLAGIAGMNVNFSVSTFARSAVFWGVLVMIIAIAASALVVARNRDWI